LCELGERNIAKNVASVEERRGEAGKYGASVELREEDKPRKMSPSSNRERRTGAGRERRRHRQTERAAKDVASVKLREEVRQRKMSPASN
jgi:hypothetical protein